MSRSGHFDFFATPEESWEILKALPWEEYDASLVLLRRGREYLPIDRLKEALLDGTASTLLIRQKTGCRWDSMQFDQGRFAGFMALILPHMHEDHASVGMMSFSDTYLEPGYPLAKPVFQTVRKSFRKRCPIELIGDRKTSGPMPRASLGMVELYRGGFHLMDSFTEYFLKEDYAKGDPHCRKAQMGQQIRR